VAKTCPTGTRALAPVDLEVRRASSSPSSALRAAARPRCCNLIAGLIAPSAGTLRWWGGVYAATGGPGRRLAMVFQSPTLMPWARVDANVRLPLDLAGVPRDGAGRACPPRSRWSGLGDAARLDPRELSGGMQMRASIARALVTVPTCC
jgi:NitT/TauT family transport system ATP-binding protein